MKREGFTRREIVTAMPVAGLCALLPAGVPAQAGMPSRKIPVSGERLPVIGLGSSKPVAQIRERGVQPLADVLQALVNAGGRVVDTWPRDDANDRAFGELMSRPGFRDALFVTGKIDRTGREAGVRQFRDMLANYRRDVLDLLQVFSLTDLDVQWANLQAFRDAGEVRYIGVTVATADLYPDLERFLGRAQPDFVQLNYSITEREAEARLLPLLADRGIAVIVNRPFMNGDYFRRLGDRAVPQWAAEFDCGSWAQFSLKYILPHAAVTCVLTETSNPRHMAENAAAALGRMPGERERERMREYIAGV